MSFKILHQFPITVDKEVEETSTTTLPDGKEVTTKQKVVKTVQITIVLKEPTRREKQDVSLHQTIRYNEAINLGLLPKLIMTQKLAKDSSSPITGGEDKILKALQVQLATLSEDYQRLELLPKPLSDEDQAKKDKVESDWFTAYNKAANINASYQTVFAHTAEQYAQGKVLMWLSLNLTYLKVGPEKYEPLFAGADLAAKENSLDTLEESKDKIYFAAVEKISNCWLLYFMGHANDAADFTAQEERWKREREIAEARTAKVSREPVMEETPAATPEPAALVEATP